MSKLSLCAAFLAAAPLSAAIAQTSSKEIIAVSCGKLDTVLDIGTCLQGAVAAGDTVRGLLPPGIMVDRRVVEAARASAACVGFKQSAAAVLGEIGTESDMSAAVTSALKTALADLLEDTADCNMEIGKAFEGAASAVNVDVSKAMEEAAAVSRELKLVAGKARGPAP
ncbi:hypothetical protein [Arvimicrobium flavum]|uniref:hypothetical protein n=1 Tax=Arvimicrobium flavum TaxID=3393320 RepID=UPI00237B353E|nr:hypothetical protein [Mesorhizobium shangrilense]